MTVLVLLAACGKAPSPPVPVPDAPLRILVVGDPFALALEKILPALARDMGEKLELDIVGYNDNRRLALLNARDHVSRYDLISFDIVWLGDFASSSVLMPLDAHIPRPAEDFLEGALDACRSGGVLYGLPIQPHAELLWARADWFDAEGIAFPRSTDDVLAAARRLHNPSQNRYGIAWNAQRGQPLGQTMCHFFAAFGQPLLDEDGQPAFNGERGLLAARYARELLDYSPPDILSMAWDQRVGRFASGSVAMTYGWGARAFMAEETPSSNVRGKVRYGPPPHAPDAAPVTPMGVWSLGIPANVASPQRSLKLLDLLFEEKHQRALAHHGNGGPALRNILGDPALQARFPVLQTMARPEIAATLRSDMRPPVPQWDALCELLGSEFHDMLLDRVSPEEALRRAHLAALELFAPGPPSHEATP